jgi:hypothetical protein
LLSELGILPLNWEESTEEIGHGTKSSTAVTAAGSGASGLNDKEREVMDLLHFPMYTQTSVRAVDEHGANEAIRKSSVLQAITKEEFYPVHPKAQRRVPVPVDIDLKTSFNQSALDNLLSVEIPTTLNVSGLSFFGSMRPEASAYSTEQLNFSTSNRLSQVDYPPAGGGGRGGGGGGGGSDNVGGVSQSYADISTVTTGVTTRNSDDVFMLSTGNRQSLDVIPLAKILGETYEEDFSLSRHRKTRLSKDKRKTGKVKHRHVEINNVEMVPAGAIDSSDEDVKKKNTLYERGHRSQQRNKAYNKSQNQSEDLDEEV